MILIVNGSPSGPKGNCQVLIQTLLKKMESYPDWRKKNALQVIQLSEIKWTQSNFKKIFSSLDTADGFIFVTGTYWDSWGSPLQIFLEQVTDREGTSTFLGKPVITLVLNHSVGGKGVLSRLQGVLSTLGCLIPPMSGLVYSWVSDQVLKNSVHGNAQKDLWSLDDIDNILENFRKALRLNVNWARWPVDQKDFRKVWLS